MKGGDTMALIRPLSEISKKWKDVTPLRSGEYKSGVDNPLKNWEKNTLAAKDRQKEGMQRALSEDRVAKGVAKAGQAKWQRKTSTLGPGRWSEGVVNAQPDYEAGFAPYHDVIAKTNPGPRYPAGDPRNWERSKKIGLALHQKKIAG